MSGIFRYINFMRIALIVSLSVFMGCSSNGEILTLPTETVSRSFTSMADTLVFDPLDVQIYVPPDLLMEGEAALMSVQMTPGNLPSKSYSDGSYTRIGWLTVYSDLETSFQDDLIVTFPLTKECNPNMMYNVFFYDISHGKWIKTCRNATITDNGTHAIFAANSFGTWGVFEADKFTVEAHASRTTARAPASISLKAVIKGGAPPYTVIWYYGDDSDPDLGLAVSHWYEYPRKYTATVTVTDNLNRTVSSNLDLNLY